MREKPAVVYPASVLDSIVVRADMESASPRRQSLQTAGVLLPKGLSASLSVGASLFAMMDDQSLRNGGWVKKWKIVCRLRRHLVGGSFNLLTHSRHHSAIIFPITQGSIANPGQLVGQRTGSLIVVCPALNAKRPLSRPVNLLSGRVRDAGRSQDGSSAVSQEHAQVAIAAFRYPSQPTVVARRVLFGRKTKPTSEMSCILKMSDAAAGGSDHRSCRQQPNSRNRQQCRASRRLLRKCSQFAFDSVDPNFKQAYFFNQKFHRGAYERRNRRIGIDKHAANLLNAKAAPCCYRNPKFTTESTQRVDARSARSHPKRTSTMKALQGLLLDRFDFDRSDICAPGRLKQRTGIGGIGLVSLHICPDIYGWQKLDLNPKRVKLPCPMMSRTASFHNDERDITIDEPALKLTAGQSVLLNDTPVGVGDSELEYGFSQVNGYSSSIHGGLLWLTDPRPHVDQRANVGAKRQGESIPSVQRTPGGAAEQPRWRME